MFLLQMAGQPGSGKSTLARLIGSSTGAVVLDKDVIKTAMLNAGADEASAGPTAYEVFFSLADHILGQGLSVVLDSPAFWEQIVERGATTGKGRMVPFYFIECVCNDIAERARRLRDRTGLRSNPGEEVASVQYTTFPPPGAFLQIDTTQPIDRCLELALDYLHEAQT